jgi:hypothetical protein
VEYLLCGPFAETDFPPKERSSRKARIANRLYNAHWKLELKEWPVRKKQTPIVFSTQNPTENVRGIRRGRVTEEGARGEIEIQGRRLRDSFHRREQRIAANGCGECCGSVYRP